MKRALFALVIVACEPVAPAAAPPTATTVATQPERSDACRKDIPDCEAACALRETNRTDYIDWYDRRCAAVILGKNPDKLMGQLPLETQQAVQAAAQLDTTPASSGTVAPLPSSRQLPPTPFDPFAGRNERSDPAECIAARSMRSHGKTREADVLAALCSAKGGSETRERKDVDLGF